MTTPALPPVWQPLKAFRIDMLNRLHDLREQYAGTVLIGTVEQDFEYKFQQLAIGSFFEHSFRYVGLVPPSAQKSRANERQAAAAQLEQLGYAATHSSGSGSNSPDDNDDIIDILASDDPPRKTEKAPPAPATVRPMLPVEPVASDFQLPASFTWNAPTKCELRPVLAVHTHPAPVTQEALASARPVTRRELLDMINSFLVTLELKPLNGREQIWHEWFMLRYLGLSPQEKKSGRAFLLIDKRDKRSFAATVAALHAKCTTTGSQQPVAKKKPRM